MSSYYYFRFWKKITKYARFEDIFPSNYTLFQGSKFSSVSIVAISHTRTSSIVFFYGVQDIKKYDSSVHFCGIYFIPSSVTNGQLDKERKARKPWRPLLNEYFGHAITNETQIITTTTPAASFPRHSKLITERKTRCTYHELQIDAAAGWSEHQLSQWTHVN